MKLTFKDYLLLSTAMIGIGATLAIATLFFFNRDLAPIAGAVGAFAFFQFSTEKAGRALVALSAFTIVGLGVTYFRLHPNAVGASAAVLGILAGLGIQWMWGRRSLS